MEQKIIEKMNAPLPQKLIKQFHYELESGVFKNRANGYTANSYRKRLWLNFLQYKACF